MIRKIAAALVCTLIGGAAVGQLAACATENNNTETKLRTTQGSGVYSLVNTVDTTDGGETGERVLDVSEMVENVMPSIVAITNQSVQEVLDMRSWSTVERESESRGSGIIVGENDDELLICTNNHVVEGANTLTVSFADDAAVEATIKGTDEDNDLANEWWEKFNRLPEDKLEIVKSTLFLLL